MANFLNLQQIINDGTPPNSKAWRDKSYNKLSTKFLVWDGKELRFAVYAEGCGSGPMWRHAQTKRPMKTVIWYMAIPSGDEMETIMEDWRDE